MRIHLSSPPQSNAETNSELPVIIFPKWDRFVKIIIFSVVIFCLIPIVIYLANFLYFNLATKQDFADFGNFFGGIVTPFLSFSTILIVLYTVKLQIEALKYHEKQIIHSEKELSISQNSFKEQLEISKKESLKNDVYKIIMILNERLEKIYREPIFFISNGTLKERELLFVLNFASEEALNQIIKPDEAPPREYEKELVKTKTVLTLLHETIVKLAIHLNFLHQYGESDSSFLFYEPTINHLSSKLKKMGYLPDDDDLSLKIMREFRQRSQRPER